MVKLGRTFVHTEKYPVKNVIFSLVVIIVVYEVEEYVIMLLIVLMSTDCKVANVLSSRIGKKSCYRLYLA